MLPVNVIITSFYFLLLEGVLQIQTNKHGRQNLHSYLLGGAFIVLKGLDATA